MKPVFQRPFTNALVIYLPGRRSCKTVCCAASCEGNRELTNRRLSHDGAVGSPYSLASSSCRNLNLRFAVKTTTFIRDRQIFPLFLKFVFIF